MNICAYDLTTIYQVIGITNFGLEVSQVDPRFIQYLLLHSFYFIFLIYIIKHQLRPFYQRSP